MESKTRLFQVQCPCCNAQLTLDRDLGVVMEHKEAPKEKMSFDERLKALDSASAERAAKFDEAERQERARRETAASRFDELLKKAQDDKSTGKPIRDVDLD